MLQADVGQANVSQGKESRVLLEPPGTFGEGWPPSPAWNSRRETQASETDRQTFCFKTWVYGFREP